MWRDLRRAANDPKQTSAKELGITLWHRQQVSSYDKNGYYNLEFDYNQDPELVMEILRHGSRVGVIGAPALKKRVLDELKKVLKTYGLQN